MLEQGYTRVGEFHYLHHDHDGTPYANPAEMATRIARPPRRPASGSPCCRVSTRTAPSVERHRMPASAGFICSVDQFAKLIAATENGRPQTARGQYRHRPHSLRAVTPDELAAICAAGRARPVHIHAAEQIREVEECIAWSGRRPVEWLLEHAPVDRRWCLIHATHTTATEITSARRKRRGRGPLPGYRSEPRRRHFSRPANSSTPAAGSASARIPMSWSASPTNCVSSNMASG